MKECKCDLRTKLVGDGCSVCNPELAKEMREEEKEFKHIARCKFCNVIIFEMLIAGPHISKVHIPYAGYGIGIAVFTQRKHNAISSVENGVIYWNFDYLLGNKE